MKDLTKSMLWALVSIPISIFGYFAGHSIITTGGMWLVPYLPAIAFLYMFGPEGSFPVINNETGTVSMAFVTQYLGYLGVILVSHKLVRVLRRARPQPPANRNDYGSRSDDSRFR